MTPPSRLLGGRRALLLPLFLLVALPVLVWMAETPSEAVDSQDSFSAARAFSQLRIVLGEQTPHPTDTAQNAAVRERIVTAFQSLGYHPLVESSFTCGTEGTCAQVFNVVVPIPGMLAGPGVLLDTHYDSVGAGPGAGDNASGVAIALEIARVLKQRTQPRRSVYMLLDDAEEQGLLGSRAFVQHSTFAAQVGWAVNLDARGVTGPSLMFETSRDNRALMRLYGKAVSRPVANSLMYSLYQRLPSETDFTNLQAHGIQGFNLAFLGGTGFYHRDGDTLAHLDPRSVQHQGEEALALVEALATEPPVSTSHGDTVYFDAFRHVVEWPRWFTPYLIALIVVLLSVASVLGKQPATGRQIEWRSVAWGAATPLPVLLLAGAVCFGALKLLFRGSLLPPRFVAYPQPYFLAVAALALAISSAVSALLCRRARLWEFLLGQWCVAAVLAAVLHIVLFGGSYLLVVPCLAAAAILAVGPLCGMDNTLGTQSMALITAIAPAVLWVPLFRLLFQGVGVLALPVVCCVLVLEFSLLLLPLWDSGRQLRWIAIASLVIAVGAGTAGAFAPPYSVDVPMPLNLFYVQNSPDKAQWLFGIGKADVPKVTGLLQAAPFSLEARPEGIIPWLEGVNVPIYVAPAAPMSSALPMMRILDRQYTAAGTCVRALVTAAPEATKIILNFPPASTPRSLNIAGTELPDPSQAGISGGWHRYATTNSPEGTVVRFCLADAAAHVLYLVAETYGLPDQGAHLLAVRPAFASASQDGNLTLRLQRVELSGAESGN